MDLNIYIIDHLSYVMIFLAVQIQFLNGIVLFLFTLHGYYSYIVLFQPFFFNWIKPIWGLFERWGLIVKSKLWYGALFEASSFEGRGLNQGLMVHAFYDELNT